MLLLLDKLTSVPCCNSVANVLVVDDVQRGSGASLISLGNTFPLQTRNDLLQKLRSLPASLTAGKDGPKVKEKSCPGAGGNVVCL